MVVGSSPTRGAPPFWVFPEWKSTFPRLLKSDSGRMHFLPSSPFGEGGNKRPFPKRRLEKDFTCKAPGSGSYKNPPPLYLHGMPMGRVKSVAIKTLGDELVSQYGDRFTEDFELNKKVLGEVKEIKSKRVRNILAGYITSKMKIVKRQGI